MKRIRSYLLFCFLMLSLVSNTQEISNIHFEQVGKQIHIYYDLHGDQEYTIQVFCSTNNGQSWGEPLKYTTGAVGENQKPGNSKMIVWDVLVEREKIIGYLIFKIEAMLDLPELRLEDIDFEDLDFEDVYTDTRDGQTYKWVKIGNQVWMAENLNYETGNSWCYDNNPANCDIYGRLYYWNTALLVCPEGWHLPSDDEWKQLEKFLGMAQSEVIMESEWRGHGIGNMLKSTSGWFNYGNGTDITGFSALPGGWCVEGGWVYEGGYFDSLGWAGLWWSATADGPTTAWFRHLYYSKDEVRRANGDKEVGYSVRCVRD